MNASCTRRAAVVKSKFPTCRKAIGRSALTAPAACCSATDADCFLGYFLFDGGNRRQARFFTLDDRDVPVFKSGAADAPGIRANDDIRFWQLVPRNALAH